MSDRPPERGEERSGCCAPHRAPAQSTLDLAGETAGGRHRALPAPAAVRLAGRFLMGTDKREGFALDGEGPVREVRLSPYRIDLTAVTNERFAAFVGATGYLTEAERFGWSYVFAGFLPERLRHGSPHPQGTPWWCAIEDADWRRPEGPGSDLDERWDHPVVHVSWNDALAFCRWSGARLPTEAEWEFAARGGLEQARYPWGDELVPEGRHRANIWQGRFPSRNTADDGFVGTSPARAFEPNGYDLYDMAGNTWEWCADWWSVSHSTGGTLTDPAGPGEGTAKVIRGGSYLCHASYCNRYRVAARTHNGPDSSTGNLGFRCTYDA